LKPVLSSECLKGMSKEDRLVTDDDEATELVGGDGAQTSNKAGLHSDARKPSNAGPDAHEEHKAPVAGAFGGEDLADHLNKQKGA
jgi:hypothetical protein